MNVLKGATKMLSTNADLRMLLKEKRIRQRQLADLLGVSKSTIYRLLKTELLQETKEQIAVVVKSYQDPKERSKP